MWGRMEDRVLKLKEIVLEVGNYCFFSILSIFFFMRNYIGGGNCSIIVVWMCLV